MPDLPQNDTTTATMDINDVYYSDIDASFDYDWVRVNMTNGQSVQVTLEGLGAFTDTSLTLYNRDGTRLDSDISFGTGDDADPQLVLTATYTGSYYIQASSIFGNTGDYQITTEKTVPEGPLDSLFWGQAIDLQTVNVYFATNGETFDGYTSEGFNAYEQGQFVAVMQYIADRTGLDFNVVTDQSIAHATIVLDLDEISDEVDPYLGYFNPPGEAGAGIGVFNGDLWDRTAGGDLEQGGFAHVTIVHEFLHGLGLAHPHDTGGTSTVMDGVSFAFDDYGDHDLNQGIFTTMSYNSGYFTGTAGSASNPFGGDFGFEGGPMALDLGVLQAMYGTGGAFQAGGNTYTMANANASGTFWETIWDTGGFDVITYNGTRGTTIDLRMASLLDAEGGGGYVSSANGISGGFTIANGVQIEAARGGFGADVITGNGADNILIGRGGNDTITGGSGSDRMRGDNGRDEMYGGAGADTVLGHSGNDLLYGGNNNDFMQGGAGEDLMYGGFNDDYMQGGNNIDALYGGNGADDLLGEQGNDILSGDQGADYLTGGGGADRFVYHSASDSLNTTSRRDVITDFTRGVDRIDLSELDAGRGIAGDQAFTFRGQGNLQDVSIGQVRFNDGPGNSVIVAVDVDADGRGDMHIQVMGVSSLNAADFIL